MNSTTSVFQCCIIKAGNFSFSPVEILRDRQLVKSITSPENIFSEIFNAFRKWDCFQFLAPAERWRTDFQEWGRYFYCFQYFTGLKCSCFNADDSFCQRDFPQVPATGECFLPYCLNCSGNIFFHPAYQKTISYRWHWTMISMKNTGIRTAYRLM